MPRAIGSHGQRTERENVHERPCHAQEWFSSGTRIPYDPVSKKISSSAESTGAADAIQVFERVDRCDERPDDQKVWTTFLPGFPDGSFGWARVDRHLRGSGMAPKLHIRIAVVNRKTCGGGNRTAKGAQAQSILMSVLQSCRHKGIRVIDIVTSILRAPDNTPIPLVNPEGARRPTRINAATSWDSIAQGHSSTK